MTSRLIVAAAVAMLAVSAWAQGSQGPVIIPKQAPEATQPAPPPPPPAAEPAQKPEYSYSVNLPEIQIPVTVQTENGDFIPNLTQDQFVVTEDGVKQTLSKVSMTNSAPITVVMLVEFRNTYAAFIIRTLQASYLFTSQLKPQDWVALVSYDIKDNIVVDFTHNRDEIYAGLNTLRFPVFTSADLFDSIDDTVARLDETKTQGRKMVLLISSGLNTFSKLTYDDLRKHLSEQQSTAIYAISTTQALQLALPGGSMQSLDMMQADNEMRALCDMTGGRFYSPRFEGEFQDIYRDLAQSVRNQYILSYVPTNKKLDGTVRKIKVSLVGPNGQPLRITDPKGKNVKYSIDYRATYTAKHIVE